MRTKGYFIPENLELTQLLNEIGEARLAKSIHIDKFHYIINNLYLRYVIRKEDWNKYLPVNCAMLRKVLTYRFATIVLNTLVRLKVLERWKRNHRAGHYSRKYRFAEAYRTKFHKVPANDGKQSNRITRQRKKETFQTINGHPALSLIEKSIYELSFDSDLAAKLVSLNDYSVSLLDDHNMHDEEKTELKKEHRIARRESVIEAFHDQDFAFSRDDYGRFHHIFTVCPRDLRPFATWKGQALYNIDVSCCHPGIASILYTKESFEKQLYIRLVRTNHLYDFINNELRLGIDFNDPIAKAKFKQNAFNKIYYGSNHVKIKPPELQLMTRWFPDLISQMQAEKIKHHRYLSHKFMRWESKIMLDNIATKFAVRHEGEDVCLISIHDSLVTTEEPREEVQALMAEEFQSILGFVPKVKCSLLSGNWQEAQLSSAAREFTASLATNSNLNLAAMPGTLSRDESQMIQPFEMGISEFLRKQPSTPRSAKRTQADFVHEFVPDPF